MIYLSVPSIVLVSDKSALKRVMRAAGNEIAAVARAMIRAGAATKKRAARRVSQAGAPPVGRSGNLARGIKVRPWKSGEGVTITDAARTTRGSRAFYALFLEKGARGGRGSGRKGVKGQRNKYSRGVLVSVSSGRVLAPHPFMTPAVEKVEANGLADRIRDALINGMTLRRIK